MRTSLIELQEEEQLLLGPSEDWLLLEAHMALDPALADRVKWLEHTYVLVRAYGQEQLRKEIRAIDRQLFTHKRHLGFRQKIISYFSSK